MAKSKDVFTKGDWIVHPTYGIGQVKGIEKKQIEGTKTRYYRVEREDTTYWLPTEEIASSRARKLASRTQFRRAIRLLSKKPREMDENYKVRQTRIRELMRKGSLRGVTRVVRDLWARRRENRLSDTERRALEQFIDSLVQEWSIAEEITVDDARAQLHDMLRDGQPAEDATA